MFHFFSPLLDDNILNRQKSRQLLLKMLTLFALFSAAFMLPSCKKLPQMSLEAATQIRASSSASTNIVSKCITKFGQERSIGTYGGYWNSRISSDPMTFNTLTARDSDSRAAIDWLSSSTVEYDPFTRSWSSGLATYKIENNLKDDTQKVICTLNDNAVWYIASENKTVAMTSADVVFWFNEVEGDPALQHPSYASHFVQMEDGTQKEITITAIDEKTFCYNFPRISFDPILEIASEFGPSFIYQPVKQKTYEESYNKALKELKNKFSLGEAKAKASEIASSAAAAALNNLFSINCDPKSIPTCGPFYIDSYQAGLKITLKRNPYYYKSDSTGNKLPYLDGLIYHIIRDDESTILEFLKGTTDTVGIPHEKLNRLLDEQKKGNFSIYFGGTALSSSFICFNQNPAAMPQNSFKWFTKKEFRQAVSCLINRDELISQIFLGLATANNDFFNKANSMYNPNIKLNYTYDPKRAMSLLEKIGMRKNEKGELIDSDGIKVKFNFSYAADNDSSAKVATIISHNLKEAGIEVVLKPTDFQKIVNSLIKTYDWEMVNVALGGNYWPTGGSNVWQSSGNFHLWRPNQESPATQWEAEVDKLYNLGRFAKDTKSAKKYWDSYQELILEQMPLIYLPYSYAFRAFQNRFSNITYDLLGGYDEGVDIRYVYLK